MSPAQIAEARAEYARLLADVRRFADLDLDAPDALRQALGDVGRRLDAAGVLRGTVAA